MKETKFYENGREIWELVDCSNDEMYFTIGLFLSLHDAIKAIDAYGKDEAIGEYSEGWEKVEIRKRKIGFSGVGEKVYERERETYYDEEADEYYWRTVKAS